MKSVNYMKYGRVIWRYGVELIAETIICFPIFIGFALLYAGAIELIVIYYSYVNLNSDIVENISNSAVDIFEDFDFIVFAILISLIVRLPWQMIFVWVWRFYLLGKIQNYFKSTLVPIVVAYIPCCILFFSTFVIGGLLNFSLSSIFFSLIMLISPSFCAAILAPWVVNKITQKNLEDIWLESEAKF